MEVTPDTAMDYASSSAMADAQNDISLAIFAKTLSTIIVIPTFALNPLMLVTLRRVTSIQPTTKIFMASLTVSDLCSGLCWLIRLLELFAGTWLLGDFLCLVYGVMETTLNAVALVSLLLLTIDRYIAISRPLRYPTLMTTFRSKVVACITWALTIMLCIVVYGVYNQYTVIHNGRHFCFGRQHEVSRYAASVFAVCVLVTIFILYVHISLIARRQARRIAAENQAGNGQDGQRISTRSTTTIIIITGTLAITWIPILIVFLIPIQVPVQGGIMSYHDFLVATVTQVLLLSNGWLNVVIYYLRNRDLREALKNLLVEWCHHLTHRTLP